MPVVITLLTEGIGAAGASVLAIIGSMSAARALLLSWRIIRGVWDYRAARKS